MSTKRQANMASIKANIDIDETQDQNASNIATQDDAHKANLVRGELATTLEINRLKKAKAQATTKDVKDKLQQEIDDAIIRRDEEIARKKAAAETITHATKTADAATKIVNDANAQIDAVRARGEQFVSGSASWLEQQSVPGSIWLPITVLLLFFFLLLPVNGKTRFAWLFQAIIGQSKIAGSGGTGGGSVGEFNSVSPVKTFTGPVQL